MSETGLIKYDSAKKALAEAKNFDEVKDIRDKSAALAAYARQAKDSEMIQWATEIKIRAERKAGAMLRDSAERGERVTHQTARKSNQIDNNDLMQKPVTLADIGITRDESSRYQKLAAIPDEHFETAIQTAKETAGSVSASFVINESANVHVSNNSGNNEWYTPNPFIEAANAVMGGIDTDPASSEIANKIIKANRFFTAEENGLQQKWEGRVFMNPPYAQPLIAQFCEALVSKFEEGEIHEAIVLVNNATETAWCQRLLERAEAVCFIKGRVRFLDVAGNPGAPLQGQCILYFGNHIHAFKTSFGVFGIILTA